jgi:hypothetical protein
VIILGGYHQLMLSCCYHFLLSAEVAKVTLKSNGDEVLSDESTLKSNGNEVLNNNFS